MDGGLLQSNLQELQVKSSFPQTPANVMEMWDVS